MKRRERFKDAAEGGWDGVSQLQAMATEGLDVAVVYPSRGLFAQGVDDIDPVFAAAIARAYDWLYDDSKPDTNRLAGSRTMAGKHRGQPQTGTLPQAR
ncbi:hypothetical protein NKDENANG_01729 [Candidatus Entotheonellaceae bacterium PAL068K]